MVEANLIGSLITLYMWAVIIRVVLSWVNSEGTQQIEGFLATITDPPLEAIRGVVPDLGGLDISPVILLIGLQLLKNMIG